MNKKNAIIALVILVIVCVNLILALNYFIQARQIQVLQKEKSQQQVNTRVVNFLALFIQKVLKVDKEVSFEDRLTLENSVRGIDDAEILVKWEKFTQSSNESQIQQSVKDLLESLVNKITN